MELIDDLPGELLEHVLEHPGGGQRGGCRLHEVARVGDGQLRAPGLTEEERQTHDQW